MINVFLFAILTTQLLSLKVNKSQFSKIIKLQRKPVTKLDH
jgi:hypothetical protein